MSELDLDHLDDHCELHTAMLQLRARALAEHDEQALNSAMQTMVDAKGRIEARATETGLTSKKLSTSIGLTRTEMQCLWLLAALQLRSDARASWRTLFGESNSGATLDQLRSVVYGERPSVLALTELEGRGILRRLGLIETSQLDGDSKAIWQISQTLLLLLHGEHRCDEILDGVATLVEPVPKDVVAVAATREALARALRLERVVTMVTGRAGQGRRTLLLEVAREAGLRLLEIDAKRLASEASMLRRQLRACARECALHDLVPVILNFDALGTDAQRLELFRQVLPLFDDRILTTCSARRPSLEWDRQVVTVEVADLVMSQRVDVWHAALGQGTREDAELLAVTYPMAPGLICRAGAAARARAAGNQMQPDDVFAGIRETLDGRLGELARHLKVTQTWNDIVLPDDQLEVIGDLIARVKERHRVYDDWGFGAKVGKGLGLAALFSGPPGTGKTMVAGLIADDLNLEIYQADLSKVVSKWIGETEKNLSELFDAAEAGHAILLFDEADSLFGKRTEVKSSNDRHANFETNYLLQRLESFTGICFMTSNHESNIDPAFHRRLSLHVRFRIPEVPERVALWRAMLPAVAPIDPSIDFDELAKRFVMTGGYIKNAAVRAAFMASSQNSAVRMEHLVRAARLEYEALGKIG